MHENAAAFAGISLSLVPVLLLMRVYEFFIVRHAHVLPDGAVGALAGGLRGDLELVLWLAAVLALPVLAIGQWHPAVARAAHRAALVVAVVASVMLVQYFATTFVPLGADLFGYSWSDIRQTTMSSKGVGASMVVPYLLFGVLTWIVSGFAARWRLAPKATGGFFAASLLSLGIPGALGVRAGGYSSDALFFLAENKSVYFAEQTARHFTASAPAAGASFARYPLLHRATYDDVLGPRFETAQQPPNIVIIVVEGLGRDFVGEGAHYGGFTPFLDSLERRSLYWDDFLSTSGRTFGIFPALLASLPHAEGGFMELGAQMPPHLSLISLLRQRGYATNYFTGTDGHFDMIDVFMERQQVDSFIDQRRFGAGYEQQPGEKGFSWGYGDRELFRRALASYGPAGVKPRLDVFLTITTHEPFIPPNTATYQQRFSQRLASLPADRREEYRTYGGVFETLLYTDDAIRYFLQEYAKRADYGRTIFVITGDHRLIPIPPLERADRYRVPFLIWSPLLKAPARFSSVSTHLDVTPSIIALLHDRYGMSFPDTVPWLGTGLDTVARFRNTRSLALMRVKNQLDEYLDGTTLLSGDQLFTVGDGFTLQPIHDGTRFDSLRAELDRAKQLSRFVTGGDHIYPVSAADADELRAAKAADSAFATLGLAGKNPEELFAIARTKALAKDYATARVIARKLLRDAPNYHDARALLGRTYSWDRQFDEARTILTGLVSRAPDYVDGYSALIDVEIWSGRREAALALADNALKRFPRDAALLAQRSRALAMPARAAGR
ncbi:MAG: sulfatase-like hydrolase/transferase [Gemmatimonadetes bacterium]|nr:sulfatase-like hydrolase/transferase [Gemmatimonadota bacterium]